MKRKVNNKYYNRPNRFVDKKSLGCIESSESESDTNKEHRKVVSSDVNTSKSKSKGNHSKAMATNKKGMLLQLTSRAEVQLTYSYQEVRQGIPTL